jgi:D-methionine transport system substrate-binding protein
MRIFAGILATVLAVAGPATGETIRVGVTAGPHAEITDVVKKVAAERGLDIKVVEFTDYVIPNQALALGDLEANSFQHEPYLKNQISKTGWKIVKVATTIASPQGVYSLKYKKLSDLPEGAGCNRQRSVEWRARLDDSCPSRSDQVERPEQRRLDDRRHHRQSEEISIR